MRNILFFLAASILVLSLNLTSTQMILIAIISAVVVFGMIIKNLLLRTQYNSYSDSDTSTMTPPQLMMYRSGGDYGKMRAMYG